MSLPPVPPAVRSRGQQYRIVATRYPPVNFFERHVPPELMGSLWALEAQTNPRLLQETGELELVRPEDRVSGPGAGIVMASFTHIGRPSRFSDGSYGVYYASRTLRTAIHETAHHRQLIAADAGLGTDEFSMRVWVGTLRKPLHDVRGPDYSELHDPAPRPEEHPLAQAFGKMMRAQDSWGIVYRSVRHAGGLCIAALRPPAVSLPTHGAHLVYVWDGRRITHVYEKSAPIVRFE
ncbi:MAG: RES family NAD+ phosphorylase [Gammaproteobacteria bacterium]|nr:RES family NAD+ phosphorylase [Gammaproteobacteria bacterium]